MKVALHVDGPRIRGNERQALLLARGLLARGHRVWVSARAKGPVRSLMERAGAVTTGARPRGDLDLVSALAFSSCLRVEGPDALLVTSWKRAFTAGWAARLAGVPRVYLRLGGLRGEERGLGARLRRFALRRWYDGVIANSEAVRRQLVDEIGVPAEAVTVIANGVAWDPAEPAALRAALGIEGDATVILAVGGLEPNKGMDLLAGALGELDGRTHVVVAGDGSPAQREAVEARARAAGAADRLHLLGHRRDIPGLLAAADLFVLPSRADSLPNALLEAMAAGVPAVMTDVGGAAEALGAGEGRLPGGWIVPPDDEAALAVCLRQVVSELRAGSDQVSGRVREARWRVENRFGAERMVEAYEAALGGVPREGASPPVPGAPGKEEA